MNQEELAYIPKGVTIHKVDVRVEGMQSFPDYPDTEVWMGPTAELFLANPVYYGSMYSVFNDKCCFMVPAKDKAKFEYLGKLHG